MNFDPSALAGLAVILLGLGLIVFFTRRRRGLIARHGFRSTARDVEGVSFWRPS